MIVLIVISSPLFLIWKDIDRNHESEVYEIIKEMIPSNAVINTFGPESLYIFPAKISQITDFPKTWAEISMDISKTEHVNKANSMKELLTQESSYVNRYNETILVEKITHIVVKEDNDPVFLNDIFENEEKYDYLIKEYDSKENGYDIHFKLFRINYEEIKSWNME